MEESNDIEIKKEEIKEEISLNDDAKKADSVKIKERHFFRSTFFVLLSQALIFVSGILVGFLLPKIFGTTNFGYFKTFTLYIAYVGVLHFGFIDGIYLKYGGKEFSEIPQERFRTYTRFLMLLELGISLIGLVISLIFLQSEYRFIFAMVAIYSLIFNMINYFQVISQITFKFSIFSLLSTLQAIFTILLVGTMFLIYKIEGSVGVPFEIYVLLYNFAFLLILLIYVYVYRKLVFGKQSSLKSEKYAFFYFFKKGFPLMLTNLTILLLLAISRQFVQVLYPVEASTTYSMYSFAYSILSLFTTIISSASVVIYPLLKEVKEEEISKIHNKGISYVFIIVFFILIFFYPVVLFANWILPDYAPMTETFRIAFPSLAVSSATYVALFNYYKATNKTFPFFILSIITLVVGFLSCLFAYLIFKSPDAITWASVGTMIVWYLLTEIYFSYKYKHNPIKNILYMFLMMLSFYLPNFLFASHMIWAVVIYGFLFIGITLLFYHKEAKSLYGKIKLKLSKKAK